ncbi:hypothetical protein DN069_14530 [Streptacidiphilus pinicola]|uniref:Zinc-finger domain-containing protein n=1 Tax=Streptacidiphilus pinicola TaxID=2219663 RepID=A0A2X0IJV1_9ACTN|nr:hypothetical protein [Streptacidiphilus pinicola]RAG84927.1 hypothetical protein DN069_14530 [Streptacidiphilus pinicola]
MSDSTLHPAHPDVELLAEHAEELLTPEQSAELTEHLATCADCQETYAALAELTTLLGDEPEPGPMPEDVVARIDAALAAERAHPTEDAPEDTAEADEDAPEGDAAEDTADGGSGRGRTHRKTAGERPEDNRPKNRSRRSTRMRRVMATLAIFIAAGGIGVAVSRGGDLDSTDSTSASSGGTSVTQPSPKAAAAPVYDFTQENLATEVQRLASDTRLHASGHAAGTMPSASDSGAATPFGTPAAGTSPSGVGAAVTPNGGPENTSANPAQPTAPACVLQATKQTEQPAVQGLGNYLGVEVFALLYPSQTDPAHTWDVYLVQNSCSAPLVLLHQSVPRT